MKICILKESLCLGGTERSAANISQVLSNDHDVCFALYDGSNVQYSYGGKLIDFKLPAQTGFLVKVCNNIKRIRAYAHLIKKERADLLFEFISINNPLSQLRHKNCIRIISSRDFSILSLYTGRFYKCLSNADAMICNSNYLRNYYITQYPEHADRVYAVHNYIHVDEICRQSQEETDPEFDSFVAAHDTTVVSVGRFCKEKGFEYLIEVFALARKNLQNLGLVLVGDGECKEAYLQAIHRFGLQDHVYFTGFQKNPYKYMQKCSCFVLSSLSEGFPNVLAEAMALGLPVISTNCLSGPAEILRTDKDYTAVTEQFEECDYGIIVPAMTEEHRDNGIDQMASALVCLLSDPDRMLRYSTLAKQRASDFSEEATRQQLNTIFAELAERRNSK